MVFHRSCFKFFSQNFVYNFLCSMTLWVRCLSPWRMATKKLKFIPYIRVGVPYLLFYLINFFPLAPPISWIERFTFHLPLANSKKLPYILWFYEDCLVLQHFVNLWLSHQGEGARISGLSCLFSGQYISTSLDTKD